MKRSRDGGGVVDRQKRRIARIPIFIQRSPKTPLKTIPLAAMAAGVCVISEGTPHSLLIVGSLGVIAPEQFIRMNTAAEHGGGLYCEESNPRIGTYPKGNPMGTTAPNLFRGQTRR